MAREPTRNLPERTLRAALVADLSPHASSLDAPFAVGVSPSGEILIAGRTGPAELNDFRGGAKFPKSRLDAPTDYNVIRLLDGEVARVRIRDEVLPVAFVQPLGDEILLVGARCRWRADQVEQNAAVYDRNGVLKRRFTLGDGIQSVRTTSDGVIWVSYFDEGVFGNYGWSSPGPAPIGAPGLVAFDATGRQIWTFDAEAAGTDTICDAYAVNVVAPDDAWVYFYTEFPLVRIRGGTYRVWPCDVVGANAFAVDGRRALLFGGYGKEERGRAHIVELGADRGTTIARASFTAEDGVPLETAYAIGVGARLFLVDGARVFAVEDGWRW